jgi:hypothetical protein
MGDNMDCNKSINTGRRSNVDTLDLTSFKGRPVNEPVLESINSAGIFMYAHIGSLAVVGNVSLVND